MDKCNVMCQEAWLEERESSEQGFCQEEQDSRSKDKQIPLRELRDERF